MLDHGEAVRAHTTLQRCGLAALGSVLPLIVIVANTEVHHLRSYIVNFSNGDPYSLFSYVLRGGCTVACAVVVGCFLPGVKEKWALVIAGAIAPFLLSEAMDVAKRNIQDRRGGPGTSHASPQPEMRSWGIDIFPSAHAQSFIESGIESVVEKNNIRAYVYTACLPRRSVAIRLLDGFLGLSADVGETYWIVSPPFKSSDEAAQVYSFIYKPAKSKNLKPIIYKATEQTYYVVAEISLDFVDAKSILSETSGLAQGMKAQQLNDFFQQEKIEKSRLPICHFKDDPNR